MVVGRQTYPATLFVLVPCVGMCSLLAGDVLGRAGEAGCSQGCCHLAKMPAEPWARLLGRRERRSWVEICSLVTAAVQGMRLSSASVGLLFYSQPCVPGEIVCTSQGKDGNSEDNHGWMLPGFF